MGTQDCTIVERVVLLFSKILLLKVRENGGLNADWLGRQEGVEVVWHRSAPGESAACQLFLGKKKKLLVL